jgi:hypothetical protein
MSAGDLDTLLQLWAASNSPSGGEPPFDGHENLYKMIDSIPIGGVPWQKFAVSYTGPRPDNDSDALPWMEQAYEVYFRDPRELFLNMLSNPMFAEYVDYVPMQQFDVGGSRRYENFMSGDWAWKQAVSLLCS